VRITVQLIHAETDAHLWAETYDRELSPGAVFGIQSDVAQRIAEALSTELTPEEASRVATRPTESQAAYDLFLRGNERRGFSEIEIRAALLAYQQAVEIDPEFALAWARLAGTHISLFFFSFDNSQDRLALARETLARAEELDPDNLEVLETLGFYHYPGELNYRQALEVFERVVRADPTRAGTVASIGYVQRRMGLLDDAAESIRKASEMDPLDELLAYQRGETAILLRRYDEAEQHLRRSVELDPEWLRPCGYLAMLPVQRDGDLGAGRAVLAEAVQAGAVGDDVFGPFAWLLIDRLSRDYDAAAGRVRNEGWDLIEGQFFYLPAEFILAEYLRYGGNSEEAEKAYRLAEAHLLAQLGESPLDHRVHSTLGRAYAGLGDATSAVEHGQRGVDLMPVEEEAYRGAFRLEDLAMIYAALGDGDAAIDVLDRLAEQPTYISRQLLGLDPAWDTLRGHSRFAALVQRYR